MTDEWKVCESPHHVGDDKDETVSWRELGLLCDTCDAAITDRRALEIAAEAERDRLREVLAELVRLKDGPRDDAYRAAKDAAWDAARDALKGADRES